MKRTTGQWHAHYEKGPGLKTGLCFNQMWNISDHNDNLLGACYQRRTARLIAAAPELLEALKRISQEVTEICQSMGWCEEDNDPTVEINNHCKAAIAKAEDTNG